MSKSNIQNWFNTAVAGLAVQGFERSLAEGGSCAFRGVEGRKCAIGHLISDEQLNALKACRWDEPPAFNVRREITKNEKEDVFLGRLQLCHDYSVTANSMKENLVALAEDNGLTIPDVLL